VAAALALIEGGTRYAAVQIPFSLYPSPRNRLQRSALMSQELRPNCTGMLAQTAFRTNAAGLRGDALGDDGSIRILALGDSCTWGWRVTDDESYPARLQQLLDQRAGAGRYQVLNAGAPGMTSYQGLQFLRARGFALRPSVVIAGYGFNDSREGGDVEALIAGQARIQPLLHLDDWFLDNSRAYRWLRWRWWYGQKRLPEDRVSVEKYTRNLEAIATESRARGAAVMFLAFRAEPRHEAARALVAENLAVPLVRYNGPEMDVVHPTAEGYGVLAAAILDRLTGDGVLEPVQGAR
jgi:lysophospholipase L1-like esterase